MKKPRQDIKKSFLNGMYPKEDDFADWLDSYWHKDDQIDAEKVVQTIDGVTRSILDLIGNNEAMQHIFQLQQDLSQLAASVSSKQPIITGAKGEVAYHNGSSVFMQPLMNEGFAVSTPEELQACKDTSPSFEEVFNTWQRFSHLDGSDNAVEADLNNWYYDTGRNTVVQPNNSTSYTGFIAPKSYSAYDVTVRVYSDNTDDDTIGLVAAFARDSNGKEHTLSFVRAAKGTGATWACIVDIRAFSLKSTANGQVILMDKSDAAPASVQNWRQLGSGSVIQMTRQGNVFTAKCSQFDSTELDDSTEITIDLDALSDTCPALELFKGSSPWGYSTFSQSNSMYENIAIVNPDSAIYNLMDSSVLKYDISSGAWVEDPGKTPVEEIGHGRFSYNAITGRLFYNNGSKILEMASFPADIMSTVNQNTRNITSISLNLEWAEL